MTEPLSLDLSNSDNRGSLAVQISKQNNMKDAALLSGELSAIFQNDTFDEAVITSSLLGPFVGDYDEIIQALSGLDADKNVALSLILGALKAAKSLMGGGCVMLIHRKVRAEWQSHYLKMPDCTRCIHRFHSAVFVAHLPLIFSPTQLGLILGDPFRP